MRPVTRAARGLSVLAVAAIALAGCGSGQAQPRSYGDVTTDGSGYFGNFMYGCTGVSIPNDDDKTYDDGDLGSEDYCKCVFQGMKETVPFDEARDFEEAQADTEKGADITVPRNIETVMDDCQSEQTPS